ncbi:glutathione S-transferase [Psychromonas algicola]|uniref:glutathione S-transferase n=1 Tax=Psychromonas algicola TaxID=2555642 RepID=UPI001068409A|nr:glutathione S-transferase [Psychromonas sp. RZ5]TEW43235.1 glutathione S-transferase [Psychromonas sp. RZ5]
MDLTSTTLPIVYSLQHCPYAMRARIAIFKSKQPVLLRAIKLNNKPPEMLALSKNQTVPMMVLPNANGTHLPEVVEESLDIMLAVLKQSDPNQLLVQSTCSLSEMLTFIEHYETGLIPANEAYKCAKRYKETNIAKYRQACEVYLQELELRLTQHAFLLSETESLLDIALMPFIRQFSKVERQWYQQSPYPKLRAWLNGYLQSPMFTKVMAKHELWVDCQRDILFGDLSTKS